MIPKEEMGGFRQSLIDEVVLGVRTSPWHDAVKKYKDLFIDTDSDPDIVKQWRLIRKSRKKNRPNHSVTFRESLINMRLLERDLRRAFVLKGIDKKVSVTVDAQHKPIIVHTDYKHEFLISFQYKVRNSFSPKFCYSWIKEELPYIYDQFTLFIDDSIEALTVKNNYPICSHRNAVTPDTLKYIKERGYVLMKELIKRAK